MAPTLIPSGAEDVQHGSKYGDLTQITAKSAADSTESHRHHPHSEHAVAPLEDEAHDGAVHINLSWRSWVRRFTDPDELTDTILST